MPIYKKAHNKYQVQVRIKGQSRYGTFDKKSLAQEMEMRFKQEIKQGRNIELTKKLTLADHKAKHNNSFKEALIDNISFSVFGGIFCFGGLYFYLF